MPHIFIPAGRLSSKKRDFQTVVSELRHAVFSVVRFRPTQQPNLYEINTLGSGFFVSSELFMTCWHVIDGPETPHKIGDKYQLVGNLAGVAPIALPIGSEIGKDIHLFPDHDLALLICTAKKDQAYLPISYADISVGLEIGVAGYPLAMLRTDTNGNPDVKNLVYRVARADS